MAINIRSFFLIIIPVFWYFGISNQVKLKLALMDITLTNYQECKVKRIKEKAYTMEYIQKSYKKVSKFGTGITYVKKKRNLKMNHYKEQFLYRIHTQFQKMV